MEIKSSSGELSHFKSLRQLRRGLCDSVSGKCLQYFQYSVKLRSKNQTTGSATQNGTSSLVTESLTFLRMFTKTLTKQHLL